MGTKAEIKIAIRRMLPVATDGGHIYNLSFLCGPSQAGNRQSVMALITGVNQPKSKSGITALMFTLCKLAEIERNGKAVCEWEKELVAWLKVD